MNAPYNRTPIGPIAYVQALVAELYDLPIIALTGDNRRQRILKPRQIAMYLANRVCRRSAAEIGRRFGGRDHTTVLYAVRCVELRIAQDAETAAIIADLTADLALRFEVPPTIAKAIEEAADLVAKQLTADLTALARFNPVGLCRALREAVAEIEEPQGDPSSRR